VYPDEPTLMEVGRIAIAAGRLDAELGALWWHLAPDLVDELTARMAPAGHVRKQIHRLAAQRLDDVHREALVAFVTEVEAAQTERNAVLHSRWLLRGPDALRPVSDFARLESDAERREYLVAWEREAVASEDWRRQPNDAMGLTGAQLLEELMNVERRLSRVTDAAVQWHFRIASMRETGHPAGWQGPPQASRGQQPLPEGAITGPAAEALLSKFIGRAAQDEA
jgi:hypothetical protein